MGLGFERAGLAAPAEQARDEGETDTEPAGDQPERTFDVIDRGGDALSEVYGIRFHPAPPLQLVLCLHFTVLAIQQGIALVTTSDSRSTSSRTSCRHRATSATRSGRLVSRSSSGTAAPIAM